MLADITKSATIGFGLDLRVSNRFEIMLSAVLMLDDQLFFFYYYFWAQPVTYNLL